MSEGTFSDVSAHIRSDGHSVLIHIVLRQI